MRREIGIVAAIAALALAAPAGAAKCPQDSVQVGGVCVDEYEASVWEIPAGSAPLIKKVVKGKIASAAQLAGAIQRGVAGDDYGPGCPDDASTGCAGFYAVSIPGVVPAQNLTWFQAVAVCANAGKRLLTNQEWQVAAFGTPDTGGSDDGQTTCNTDDVNAVSVLPTGSRSACVSARGAFDMVGNVWEIVGDWMPAGTSCPGWGAFSDDFMCFGGASTSAISPGVLLRGGDYSYGAQSGLLSVDGTVTATLSGNSIGFRCGREL